MNKPMMKTEVAISEIMQEARYIWLYATPDAIDEFSGFGEAAKSTTTKDLYIIKVDARFDFDEVVEYIKGYSK